MAWYVLVGRQADGRPAATAIVGAPDGVVGLYLGPFPDLPAAAAGRRSVLGEVVIATDGARWKDGAVARLLGRYGQAVGAGARPTNA